MLPFLVIQMESKEKKNSFLKCTSSIVSRFVTVFQIFFFFRLLFSGSINDVILVLGDCHVLLDQGICFESSMVDSG